ncbi:kinase-like protein [Lizonia empirigonia]|nr:kinase-like protein [Lizonia empirigonia]
MQESVIQWPLGLDRNDLVGAGVTAIVVRLDAFASQTSIRQYIARQKQAPLSLKLRWVQQLVDAVRFIHSRGVFHGDMSCNNVFLDDNFDVKLGDFAGSAIDDLPPLVCYETSHELPGKDISTETELFALGSTIYEVMTGSKPYEDLPEHEVAAAFSEGRYPDLESVSAFKNTIMKCWTQKYATAEEAFQDVNLEVATMKKARTSRFKVLLSHQSVSLTFLLTVVSLVPCVGWIRRWRSLQ